MLSSNPEDFAGTSVPGTVYADLTDPTTLRSYPRDDMTKLQGFVRGYVENTLPAGAPSGAASFGQSSHTCLTTSTTIFPPPAFSDGEGATTPKTDHSL